MNRFFGKLAKAAMIAAVLCLVAGGALAKDPERPYRGRGEATLVSVGQCDPGIPGIFPPELWEGPYIATHSGLSEASTCVVATGFANPFAVTVAGQGVSTVANGDQAYFTISGTTDFSSDPCIGKFTIMVVAGTGRFEAGSGLIQVEAVTPWSAPFTCGPEQTTTFSGTITY